MKLQKLILKAFKESQGKTTYDKKSKALGIERTRLFRIENGVPMRIDEMEKFLSFLTLEEKQEILDLIISL